MKIDGLEIGQAFPPYIVAEMSANHNGSIDRAKAIIEVAADIGADAVKIQLYDPHRLANSRGGPDQVLTAGPWKGRRLLDLYIEGHTPIDWVGPLFAHAREVGITLFSSVFDEEGIDYLERLRCPAYKIASFELTNRALIAAAAKTKKPVIASCGMASGPDISLAIKYAIGTDIALLHCVSAYPCPVEQANLGRIKKMRKAYHKPIGWSDHTLGMEAAITATALGAVIIEKHLTLDRHDGGIDSSFSMEPAEFMDMVASCRNAWLSMQEPTVKTEPYRHLRSKVVT